MSHPLRRRILSAYLEGAVECASTGELATALDQRVGQVAYHLKTLAKSEILRPVPRNDRQEPREPHCGWALGVEEEWLRVILAIWAETELPR